MENKASQFSITIYTENQIGLLVKICSIFTRRGLSIWSLNATATFTPNVHRIVIVVIDSCEKSIKCAVEQVSGLVDVINAFYTKDEF